MIEAIEQVLNEHADDGSGDDPSLGWDLYVNAVAIRITAATKESYATEQQAFTAAVLLANRLHVDGVHANPHADHSETISAQGSEGDHWHGKVELLLTRA